MNCTSCRGYLKKKKINLGKFDKSNIFTKKFSNFTKYKKIKLELGECSYCQLIQLSTPQNFRFLLPNKNWIVNKEEDKHHIKFSNLLLSNKFIGSNEKILFLTQYDNKFFDYFHNLGFKNLIKLDLKKHLKFSCKDNHRQEVVQDQLNYKNSKKIIEKFGKFDFIFCSKLLEHTKRIKNFFGFVNEVLSDNGKIVIDVPDCQKSLVQGNITMPWEEHVSYFIKSTLDSTLKIHGYKRTKLKVYKYNQENALVGLYQKNTSKKDLKFLKISYLQKFNREVKNFRKKTKKFFLKNSKKTLILFGAGHNSNAFFNILNLKETNLDIVDDNKNKLNCFFAGTRKKIKSSNLLKKNFQSIVLLTLNYESEKKIIKLFQSKFKKNNHKYFSIYPDSPNFFLKRI
tara:strand:+ start:1470 stop:2663 length:1194 start_codon:yes stop_codon:yes gene_type:complete